MEDFSVVGRAAIPEGDVEERARKSRGPTRQEMEKAAGRDPRIAKSQRKSRGSLRKDMEAKDSKTPRTLEAF